LIFLVEDKRDLPLKTAIKRHIRLVSFSDGRIEMNLVENPSRDFLTKLAKRLEEWTGKRWMLSISQEEGAPTLAELDRAENEAQLDNAKSVPAVEAIMRQFPGAKIVDIRVREDETEGVAEVPEEEELDEFFEE
ncbi:MAG: DNA polymerase III subunit gamma/tau, partial [Pseudomonadota bacterium]